MIPTGIHQVDVSLKHGQVIGIGGEFTIVPAHVSGSPDLVLLIPNDDGSFDVVSNRIDLGTVEGRRNYDGEVLRGHPAMCDGRRVVDSEGRGKREGDDPHGWTTLTFRDDHGVVTCDRGVVHDYDGDGIWTWHDEYEECGECLP